MVRPVRLNPPNKFNASRTKVNGISFASRREARRWEKLRDLARAGVIQELRRQVRYPLHAPDGSRVGFYVADFEYREDGALITEDAKGMKTDLYVWKKRHFEAEYGRHIRET